MMFLAFWLILFVAIGRFSVPGHSLTGWPGVYEALAHMAVGFLICLALVRSCTRRVLLVALAILTLLEVGMFLTHTH